MREPQEVTSEENEEIVQRVAAIDVAKASGMVCTRIPHPSKPDRRLTKVWTLASTTNAIMELADHLAGQGIERIVIDRGVDRLTVALGMVPRWWKHRRAARSARSSGTAGTRRPTARGPARSPRSVRTARPPRTAHGDARSSPP